MDFPEAKLEFALDKIGMLSDQFSSVQACYEKEREERGRALENHMQAAENKSLATLEAGIDKLGERLQERLELFFRTMRAENDTELKSIVIDVGNIKQDVAELDVRTRDVPLLKGRLEHIEMKPGLNAIKAWQWMAAGGLAAAGTIFGIVSLFVGK